MFPQLSTFSDSGNFKIEKLSIDVDKARLFNNEYVQWGIMRVIGEETNKSSQ